MIKFLRSLFTKRRPMKYGTLKDGIWVDDDKGKWMMYDEPRENISKSVQDYANKENK